MIETEIHRAAGEGGLVHVESRERVGSGGLGLMLVEGLVTRELGGTFEMSRLESGGSVARVQFPISGDET